MEYDDVLTRNDDGELAVRTVSATEQSTVINPNDVYTRDTDGNLCIRTTGGGDNHNKGYFATPEALSEAYPTGEAGDFAIVESTDTVWIWDSDNSAWVDSDQKGQVTSVNNQTGAVSLDINDVAPTQTGKSGYVLGTDGFVAGWVKPEIVQRSTMPQASEEEVDNIYQYVGTTDANYTNGYFYKCVSDGQTPATYSWENIEVQEVDALPSQTGNSGKFLTTDGTDASWSNKKVLINTVDGSNTTSVNIEGINLGTTECVSVGKNSQAGERGTSVGYNSNGTVCSCAYGCESKTFYENTLKYCATAIGYKTTAGADNAIQLGCASYRNGFLVVNVEAINSDANTFKVANANGNFEIMSADGTIPTARLTKVNTTITLASANWSSNSQTVNVTGITATGVVIVSPDPTDQSAYTSAGIICSAQAAGSLEFTCTNTPTNDIDVNVVCL